MTYIDTKDLRTLASEWRELLDEASDLIDEGIDPGRRDDISAEIVKYENLCDEFGIDKTPDALDWFGNDYDPTLVAESDFAAYAEELADELGYLGDEKASQWPFTCIDWEQAARELAYDYTSVTFDGTDYYIRSF